jgi:hypothetical protein
MFLPVEDNPGLTEPISNRTQIRASHLPKRNAVAKGSERATSCTLPNPLFERYAVDLLVELGFGKEVPGVYVPQQPVSIDLLDHTHVAPSRDASSFLIGLSRWNVVIPITDPDGVQLRAKPMLPCIANSIDRFHGLS